MIVGFSFLFMYIFMPEALKRIIASAKGSRYKQKAKNEAKKNR